MEELGLNVDIQNSKLVEIDKYMYGTLDDGFRMLTMFTVKIDWPVEKFLYPVDEVAELRWISKSRLHKEITVNPGEYLPHANTWIRFLSAD